ncbi:MAG: FAD-binding oxidoreductase [Rhizobacter sp.]|nr:FAD-binding oxidoreductase [Bacteriovorax sp.]
MNTKSFYSNSDVVAHLQTGMPTLFHSSQTSTVIPFEKMEGALKSNTVMGNLSTIKGALEMQANGNLKISGFVTWKEAKEFCLSKGREIMTSPTEELAGVLAGIATSCTGERSFGFRNLRSQIVECNYLDFNGVEHTLSATKKLDIGIDLADYQKDFSHYAQYKNAPYPRMEFETDLMTGTEGQLGVIDSAILKTIEHFPETYIFMLLPRWEENFEPHLELYNAVQKFRDRVRACEILDSNSLSYLPPEKNPGKNNDVVFLEIRKDDFENIYEDLLSHLTLLNEDQIFEMDATKCRDLRVSVPRAVFEANSRMGVTKKGTDVQVSAEKFKELLLFYRKLGTHGVPYNLFGHFGDAHLHFNFMPTPDKENFCNAELESLYEQVLQWKGSPFAEHGIGLLKRKFIAPFYSETQKNVFRALKKKYDPKGQFFPEGFMTC